MIFPIGDDNIVGGHKPIVSYSLIIANVLVFVYEISLGTNIHALITDFGATPSKISSGVDLHTLFSSIFLHGGWMHIIGNMIFLWIFADNIEAIIGSFAFVLFYFLGGLFASLVHVYVDPSSVIPSIGASGAISAVMGAYLVMFPKSKIKLIFILFFTTFELPAIVFLGFWFVQQLYSGMGSESIGQSGGIAWWAHIGGFAYGLLIGYILKRNYGHRYSYNA